MYIEGGTRVPAFATWSGHIPAGTGVNHMIHMVDMLPTLVKLARGSTQRCKPLDGRDVWPALAGQQPTGRNELVYNLEPYRAAIRKGDWKLIWSNLLPSRVELYQIAEDPNEEKNLADQHPDKVKALQQRIEKLAAEAQKPLFFGAAAQAVFSGVFGPAPIPMDDNTATAEP